jgi:SAM-dependent methyltransferase
MPWTWVRPADPSLLDGRPLIDLGTGDGRTPAALGADGGLVVGVDRSPDAIRAARKAGVGRLVRAEAAWLPFRDGAIARVVAGDLFHHLAEAELASVLSEVRRVLRRGGLLVAWWYERGSRPAPDAPRFPRPLAVVDGLVTKAGFASTEALQLEFNLEPAPATVGLLASRP